MSGSGKFQIAFEFAVGSEGLYNNNPEDRGNWTTGEIGNGELKGTKYGISAMKYPLLDIKNLTLEQAKQLYERDYWQKIRGDDLPVSVGVMVFDMTVNQGDTWGPRMLQEVVRVTVDGKIGSKTITAVNRFDETHLVKELAARRMVRYAQTPTFPIFGLGWSRRLMDCVECALSNVTEE